MIEESVTQSQVVQEKIKVMVAFIIFTLKNENKIMFDVTLLSVKVTEASKVVISSLLRYCLFFIHSESFSTTPTTVVHPEETHWHHERSV